MVNKARARHKMRGREGGPAAREIRNENERAAHGRERERERKRESSRVSAMFRTINIKNLRKKGCRLIIDGGVSPGHLPTF